MIKIRTHRGLIFLFISLFTLQSCSDDNLVGIEVNGRIVSNVTGEGMPNIPFTYMVTEVEGSGILSNTITISQGNVITDKFGNFTTTIYYESGGNVCKFWKGDDEWTTDFLSDPQSFWCRDLDSNVPIKLEVRKYEEMKVYVKNTNPIDDDDSINVSIHRAAPTMVITLFTGWIILVTRMFLLSILHTITDYRPGGSVTR